MKPLLISSFVMQITAGVATMVLASPALGQDLGSVVQNGVEMKVKTVVAVWDPKEYKLKFTFIPYVPTPAEIKRIQAGQWYSIDQKSPDSKKWPSWSPSASYTVSWSFAKDSVGDYNKAHIQLSTFGIDVMNNNFNLSSGPGEYIGTLKGTVKVGGKVELTAKGKDVIDNDTVSWDLHARTKVLAFTGK